MPSHNVFEKLQGMVNGLETLDFQNYKNSAVTRKRLQEVKREVDRLRKEILAQAKVGNPKLFGVEVVV